MRFSVSKNFMFVLLALLLTQPFYAQATELLADEALLCVNNAQKIEKQYHIQKHMLTTIANVESGKWSDKHNQTLAWPWTVNQAGKSFYLKSKQEAIAKVKELQAQGHTNIDVGCMQINLAYHPDAFENLEEAFSPAKNVEYAAKFLTKLKKQKNSWLKAAMAYHSKTPAKANKYKNKLLAEIKQVKVAENETGKKLFSLVKKIRKRNKNSKIDAKQWREAKLEEYRRNQLEK